MSGSKNALRMVVAFLIGGAVFPLWGKVYEYFLFSQVEILYPNIYIWIYIGVLGFFLLLAILSSIGVIKDMPKKLQID